MAGETATDHRHASRAPAMKQRMRGEAFVAGLALGERGPRHALHLPSNRWILLALRTDPDRRGAWRRRGLRDGRLARRSADFASGARSPAQTDAPDSPQPRRLVRGELRQGAALPRARPRRFPSGCVTRGRGVGRRGPYDSDLSSAPCGPRRARRTGGRALLPARTAKPLPDQIKADMAVFLETVRADATFKPSDLGLKMSAQDALARQAEAYGL